MTTPLRVDLRCIQIDTLISRHPRETPRRRPAFVSCIAQCVRSTPRKPTAAPIDKEVPMSVDKDRVEGSAKTVAGKTKEALG